MKISIIGLGVIGSATLEEMVRISKKKKLYYDFHCIDINKTLVNRLDEKYSSHKNVSMSTYHQAPSDVYIVSVYTPEQVLDVLKDIRGMEYGQDKVPLVIIESTVTPDILPKVLLVEDYANLILCPHRYNPHDPDHAVFNLNRVIAGGREESLSRGIKFYSQFMPKRLLFPTRCEIAALVKPLENTYRFIEIAIAEEWRMECDRLGIDFDEMRVIMNTKWNIDLKEARDGIGGTCLPKDSDLMRKWFSKSKLIKTAKKVDKKYRENYAK